MVAITKQKLSGSTSGRGILVAATATARTLIHTAINTADIADEVWIYAHNSQADAVKLTLEMGGVTVPNDLIEQSISGEDGLFLVVPGLILDTGVILRAFGSVANVVNLFGYVNRIDQT